MLTPDSDEERDVPPLRRTKLADDPTFASSSLVGTSIAIVKTEILVLEVDTSAENKEFQQRSLANDVVDASRTSTAKESTILKPLLTSGSVPENGPKPSLAPCLEHGTQNMPLVVTGVPTGGFVPFTTTSLQTRRKLPLWMLHCSK
jgi:hypothetical protein